MTATNANIDPAEVAKFDTLASRWWDPEGEFRPLHALNPVRVAFIERHAELAGREVLDVGCGGGILTESLARAGANVTGIDMAPEALQVADLHRRGEGLEIRYEQSTGEDWAAARAGDYDVVTCLELLEHVPDPASLVAACATLVRPGGDVFFSTVNRNPKAYALAVVAAEYVLRLLPRGTHDYRKFIRPSELGGYCRAAGLDVTAIAGLRYDPLTGAHALSDDVDVNYIVRAVRPAEAP